jgi:hypothetical protein
MTLYSERAPYLRSILSIDRPLVSVEVELSEDSEGLSSYGSASPNREVSSSGQDWKGERDKDRKYACLKVCPFWAIETSFIDYIS